MHFEVEIGDVLSNLKQRVRVRATIQSVGDGEQWRQLELRDRSCVWCTRCNYLQRPILHLFDIANSYGRTGEQVRGDIEKGLKFLHILMIVLL